MSTKIESYLIYGLKFGEEFTNEFWNKDFRDEMEWNENKPKDKPFFVTDGMNGAYTFFGFITQLTNGNYDDLQEKEIDLSFTKVEIISKFYELYPDEKVMDEDIKMFFLPHWV